MKSLILFSVIFYRTLRIALYPHRNQQTKHFKIIRLECKFTLASQNNISYSRNHTNYILTSCPRIFKCNLIILSHDNFTRMDLYGYSLLEILTALHFYRSMANRNRILFRFVLLFNLSCIILHLSAISNQKLVLIS